ncbi:MAG: hypothetical protein PVH41_03095 [Anaerolineae bacterium]|jgi:hypothetical protein
MKTVTLAILFLVAFSLVTVAEPGAPLASPGATVVVIGAAESGTGTLRQALLDAQYGNTITFDPTVFPPRAPVTISVTSELPTILVGNLTIDASGAGLTSRGSRTRQLSHSVKAQPACACPNGAGRFSGFTVLVIACPHTRVLAIPPVVAISSTMRACGGILARDRISLEAATGIDKVPY